MTANHWHPNQQFTGRWYFRVPDLGVTETDLATRFLYRRHPSSKRERCLREANPIADWLCQITMKLDVHRKGFCVTGEAWHVYVLTSPVQLNDRVCSWCNMERGYCYRLISYSGRCRILITTRWLANGLTIRLSGCIDTFLKDGSIPLRGCWLALNFTKPLGTKILVVFSR